MTYKYHYIIVNKHNAVIATAQDLFMKNCKLNDLRSVYGSAWYCNNGIRAKKVKITIREWKKRYC